MKINKFIWAGILAVPLLLSSGCKPEEPIQSNKTTQSQIAQRTAESITFAENGEIENIKRRLELTSSPQKLMYIVLVNQMGQPILYEGVRGKVTSGGKALTPRDRVVRQDVGVQYSWYGIRAAPSDEGTYGSSGEYIFYWNTDGVYRQWAGPYLLSDQPIHLSQPTLVIMQSK